MPFCDGTRAVAWDSEDIFANLDEGWERYFRGEAEREGRKYAEERTWELLNKSVFSHPCNYDHWIDGVHTPINPDSVAEVGYFYWPDVIVQ